MENLLKELTDKYNIAVTRYTSYPTTPYWDNQTFAVKTWKDSVNDLLTKATVLRFSANL